MQRIDVVFDVPESGVYFPPTIDAVKHAADREQLDLQVRVVRTADITDDWFDDLPAGIVIGPGTPYNVPNAAERVIRTARERGVPLVGT